MTTFEQIMRSLDDHTPLAELHRLDRFVTQLYEKDLLTVNEFSKLDLKIFDLIIAADLNQTK